MTTLAEKRASLHASLEQHIGQVNRHNGAIAILDELIAEEAQREEAETQEEMALPVLGGVDRRPLPFWYNNVNTPEDAASSPPSAPEMLPVVRGTGDDDEESGEESTLCNVHFRGDGIPQHDL